MKKLLLSLLVAIPLSLFGQDTRLFLEYNYAIVEDEKGVFREGKGTNSFILDVFDEKDIVHVNDRGNVILYKVISNTLFEMKTDAQGVKYREATIRDNLGTKIYLVLLNDGERMLFLFFPDFTIRFEVR